jgi:hypothetical protein
MGNKSLFCSTYLRRAIVTPDDIVQEFPFLVAGLDYDTLVGTGMSGAFVVPRLAEALGKEFLLIRKNGDSPHREYAAEGVLGERWVFVDDFIVSGKTFDRVLEAVTGELLLYCNHVPLFVGAYEYHHHRFSGVAALTGRAGISQILLAKAAGFFPVATLPPPDKPNYGIASSTYPIEPYRNMAYDTGQPAPVRVELIEDGSLPMFLKPQAE